MRAGVAETKITPPIGIDLSGYAARPGPSIGLLDDLWCRVLLLEDNGTHVGIIALDVLGVDFELDTAIRRAASAHIPTDHILINCSHTHAGPSTTDLDRRVSANHDYLAWLVDRIGATMTEAASRLATASLQYRSIPARIGINRRERQVDGAITIGRNPEGLVDQEVRVLRVDQADGTPLAVLFNYACHGTTLGGENRLISADWMGAACAHVTEQLHAPTLFLQGCAGQTNPDAVTRSPEEMYRLGALAGEALLHALQSTTPLAGTPLRARREEITLPLQNPPSPARAREELAQAEAAAVQAKTSGAHPYWVRALESLLPLHRHIIELADQQATDLRLPFVVQVMRIGDMALVGLSGEIFLEFAQHIAAQSSFTPTWVLGYSNGCECYVPTAAAMAEGGYEAVDSFRWYGTLPLASHAGDEMAAAAVRLLQQVTNEVTP